MRTTNSTRSVTCQWRVKSDPTLRPMSKRRVVACVQILLLTVVGTPLQAQHSGGQFSITSSRIDSGGEQSSGAQYIVRGSIGQIESSSHLLTGGVFQLRGGFQVRGAPSGPNALLFSDGFETQVLRGRD